jgi:hypothetical protein
LTLRWTIAGSGVCPTRPPITAGEPGSRAVPPTPVRRSPAEAGHDAGDYLAAVDGLRFVAIGWVLLFHLNG